MGVPAPPTVSLPAPPAALEITLPGGLTIRTVPMSPGGVATDLSNVQSLMLQLGPALGGVYPVLTLIDTVIALKDTVESIPGLIAGDVESFVDALSRVAEGVETLIGMAPQASVPVLVMDVIAMLVATLTVVENLLDQIISIEEEAAAIIAEAQAAGNAQLEQVGNDLQAHADSMLAHTVESIGPVDSLLSLIQSLLEMISGPAMPSLGDLTGGAEQVKETITALRTALELISIPGG